MTVHRSIRAIVFSVLGLTSLVPPAAAEQPTKADFSSETVGAEPKSLVAVWNGRRRGRNGRSPFERRAMETGGRWSVARAGSIGQGPFRDCTATPSQSFGRQKARLASRNNGSGLVKAKGK